MKKVFFGLIGFFFCGILSFATAEEYISELEDGKIKFQITYSERKDFVEVFVKKNEIQTVAQNITDSIVDNQDGTFSYHLIHSGYLAGDLITTRFYSHAKGVQQFTPQPFAEGILAWSKSLIYTNSASGSPYITELAEGKVQFTLGESRKQDYVEIFVRKNGVQMIAEDITDNYNSSLGTYYLIDSGYKKGDKIDVRFYTHTRGSKKFIPGSTQQHWSKHKYGTYKNSAFDTADASYIIGAHKLDNGDPIHTEVFFDLGFDYLTPWSKIDGVATSWLVDRALAQSFSGEYLLNTVEFKGMYVRHCTSGKWVNINSTVYAPLESPLLLGVRGFSLNHHYENILTDVLLDTDFSCPGAPPKMELVMLGGAPQHVLARGRVHFAYVIQHQ